MIRFSFLNLFSACLLYFIELRTDKDSSIFLELHAIFSKKYNSQMGISNLEKLPYELHTVRMPLCIKNPGDFL